MSAAPSPARIRAIRVAQSKARLTTTLAFFIMGLSLVFSFNSEGGFASYGWVLLPIGVTLGIALILLGRRWMKKPRPCPACHQSIPWDAEICPLCGTQVL